MPLQTLSRFSLKPEALTAACDEVTVLVDKVPADATLAHQINADLKLSVGKVQARIGKKAGNAVTSQQYQADVNRDSDYTGLFRVVKGLRSHIDPQWAQAASQLHDIFVRHDTDLPTDAYAVESTKLNALLAELLKPENLARARTIGVEPAVMRLDGFQKEFERLSVSNIKGVAENSVPQLREFLAPLRQQVGDLFNVLRAEERRNPGKFKATVDELNQLVTKYQAKAQALKTRGENEDDASTTSSPESNN
jgi:hypothetical protein